MLRTLSLSLLFLTSITAVHADAPPPNKSILYNKQGQGIPESDVAKGKVNWRPLVAGQDDRYNGIAQIQTKEFDYHYGCSGALIDVGGGDDAPVYALTAAHCFFDEDPPHQRYQAGSRLKKIKAESPLDGSVSVARFQGQLSKAIPLPIKKLTYANHATEDLALVEVKTSKAKLRELNIHLYRLGTVSSRDFPFSTTLVGTPINGLDWKTQPPELSTCSLESAVYGLGHGYPKGFTFDCSVIGGTSGSPLFLKNNDKIIAVDSTGYDFKELKSFYKDSDLQDPSILPQNFSASTEHLVHCFDSNGKFDLDAAGCTLDKPCETKDTLACLKSNCEHGSGRACYDAAFLSPESSREELYKQSCELGDGIGCDAFAAAIYGEGKNAERLQEALLAERQGCDFGYGEACRYAGGMLEGLKANQADIDALAVQACREESGAACRYLGDKLLQAYVDSKGAGIAEHDHQMRNLLARACFLGDAWGCGHVGLSYLQGYDLTPSPEKGVHFLELGCKYENGWSCKALSLAYDKGLDGVKASPRKAKQYAAKACKLGEKDLCPQPKE